MPHTPENIVVIPRATLFAHIPAWHGIHEQDLEQLMLHIRSNLGFAPRPEAEKNFALKQIIPYVLFMHGHKIFVMQRKSTASEQRLANKFSLGIGGHIRQDDIVENNIFSWAQREFVEEVSYHGSLKYKLLGILNDDSNEVGQLHLGIVILAVGNSDQISIKDEHKQGMMMSLLQIQELYPDLESWSQLCFKQILQNPQVALD